MKKILLCVFVIFFTAIGSILIPFDILHRIVVYVCGVAISIYLSYIFMKIAGIWDDAIKRFRGILFAKNRKILISENLIIKNKDRVTIGENVSIGKCVDIFPVGGSYPSKIVIGNNVTIGDYNRFASCDSVEIGDDVLCAAYVHITDHSHEFKDIKTPIVDQGIFSKGPVKIGKGAWLGYRSEILSGVTIGEHSVVAAGAVVTSDVPPFSIVAGIPAKVIKHYDFEKKEWVRDR